ncbi:MAG TPA: ATP-binding SpoIIE family protein phosphatase [Burkholderiales bacterium]|nr:ATP-binding SpoIIE family protein phosphatase [Burkholderiales bacterium]
MNRQFRFEIQDSSQTGLARRTVQDIAAKIGMAEAEAGKVAIAVNELGSNLIKHGKGGELLVRALDSSEGGGLEILALDRGAGMADMASSMRDGFSTAGTMGTGLGSLSRLASVFDVFSAPGKGTVVCTRFASGKPNGVAAGMTMGAVCLPKPGEEECGDDWTFTRQDRRHMLMVADGLGHGPDAHKAARVAVDVAQKKGAQDPASVLDDIHAASRATRGAAVSVCAIEHSIGVCRFAGIGNVSCAVVAGDRARFFASHAGIIGHSVRKIQEFSAPWPAGALLVMHSDGLATQWNLAAYPGLASRHPGVIAGVLFRDFTRGRDDVTVVVARDEKPAAQQQVGEAA